MSSLLVSDSKSVNLTVDGPGGVLRSSRRAQDMSVNEVAEKLHLSHDLIRALESDDYEALPSAVFVQGYLRNYARLLDEPIEPILQAYNAVRPDDSVHTTKVLFNDVEPEVNSRQGGVRLVTWLIVGGLAVLLFLAWKGYLDDVGVPDSFKSMLSTESVTEVSINMDASLSDSTDLLVNDDVAGLLNQSGLEPVVSLESPLNNDSVTDIPLAESRVIDADNQASVMDQSIVSSDAQSIDPLVKPNEPLASETKISSGSVIASEENNGVELVLSFRGASWVDIRDSRGRSLKLGEVEAGSTLNLEGQAPYRVVLGKPDLVDIKLNGEAYDMSQYAGGRVARFNLTP